MQGVEGSKKIETNFIYQQARITPDLKPYIPIVDVGITLLLDTWEFPEIEREGASNTRIRLTPDNKKALLYLAAHSGKSLSEVISAALIRAKNSKVRPNDPPGSRRPSPAAKHIMEA